MQKGFDSAESGGWLTLDAVEAMNAFQQEMAGEAEQAGLTSDGDVVAAVKHLRGQENK